MLALMLLLQTTPSAAALIAETRALTRATTECRMQRDGDDIVVCARRDADRWRVPYLIPTPGDPKAEDAPGDTERLIARPNACAEMRLMAYGCGMAGVSATAGARGVGVHTLRPLAP